MRLCSYVVVHDTGFAPNPFGGYCTLAACTPNRQGLKLRAGDWLLGHSAISRGQKLIYAMQLSEVLDFDEYYRDPRFSSKKPALSRTWKDACGDNIYHRAEDGTWIQNRTPFHNTADYLRRDTRHPRVFVSETFYYFGENAPPIPAEFTVLVRDRHGCRCNYPAEVVQEFIRWLQGTFDVGVHGDPRDRRTKTERGCFRGMCTDLVREPDRL